MSTKNLLFSLLVFTVWADKKQLGSTPGVIDRLGVGVAQLGAGNTGTARTSGIGGTKTAEGAYWNPALLAFGQKTRWSVGEDIRSLSRNGGYVSGQGPVAPNMSMGLTLANRGDFNVPVYNADEEFLGTSKPQDIMSYLGIGFKTTRKNSFGVGLQWYVSNLDIGGEGNVSYVGFLNAGWFRIWSKKWQTGVTVRNLGLNESLTARFDYNSQSGESGSSLIGGNFTGTTEDFFPKTLVLAAQYQDSLFGKKMLASLEVLNYQLSDALIDTDLEHHSLGWRMGTEWLLMESLPVRAGWDQGNWSLGFGYQFQWKKRYITVDYALLIEDQAWTVNPYALGIQIEL